MDLKICLPLPIVIIFNLLKYVKPLFQKNGKKIRFCLPDENFHFAYLAGDFTQWEKHMVLMKQDGLLRCTEVDLPPNKIYAYKFLTSKGWIFDRSNPERKDDDFSSFNSIIRLDSVGNILTPIKKSIFHRRSESSKIILYTRKEDFQDEESLEHILNKIDPIYNYVQQSLDLENSRSRNKVKIFYRKVDSFKSEGLMSRNEIYLTSLSFNLTVICHELVHYLLRGKLFNSPLIKEGIATLIENKMSAEIGGRFHSMKQIIKYIQNSIRLNFFIPLDKLYEMKTFIKLPNPKVAYYESALFVNFLFEKYGKERTWRYLHSGNSSHLSIMTIHQLENEFQNYVLNL